MLPSRCRQASKSWSGGAMTTRRSCFCGSCNGRASLLGGAARLHGRCPLLEVALHQVLQILRRPAFPCRHIEAETFEPLAHRRNIADLADCRRKPAHDRLRCTFGKEERVPAVTVEILQSLLMRGWHLRHC